MPIARIGYGTDFILKDQGVGIGTDTAGVKLEVGGTTKANYNITGIASLTNYAGFAAAEQNIVGIRTVTGEHSTLGDIVVGVGSVLHVSTGATVCTGSVESISITGHFAPPCGSIEDRQECPVEGTVRFNKDLNTLEFYNGVDWRQFTVNGSSGRGLFAGGQPSPSSKIDYLELNTLGNGQDFGNLISANPNKGGFANSIRAVFIGGASNSTDMDYVTIASAGNGIDFGNLSVGRAYLGGASSSTRGFGIGGYASPVTDGRNIIDYVEIMQLGTALDFGDLFTGCYSPGCASSPTRAFAYSGALTNSGDTKSTVEVFTMASKGNATDFGNVDTKRRNIQNGCSSSTRAVFAGGFMAVSGSPDAAVVNTISYITMASEGNAIDFGDMTQRRQRTSSASTQTRAVFYGGAMGNPTVARYNTIDYITFATTGNAVDFGDTADQTDYTKAGCSDSHGGLGGY